MLRLSLILLLFLTIPCLSAEPAADSALEDELFTIIDTTPNTLTNRPIKEKVYPRAENFFAIKSTGEWTSLNAYEGKVVILTFWATYDRYCLKSIQLYNELFKKYQKKGLEIVAVAIDDTATVREFLEKNPQINYTILYGSTNLAKLYDVWGLPTTYILDRELSIRKVFTGYLDRRSLEKEIKKLL